MPTFASAGISSLDWIIIASYLALIVISGLWLARREPEGSREYFLANRRMPVWAVVCSIIASSLSVATFVGVPEQSFKGDLTYLSTNIGGILAVFVIAWVFIPAFYKANCVSIYEILEHRMGPGAKHAASAAFMVGRVFASGARIYIAAIPIAAIMFGLERQADTTVLITAILTLSFAAVVVTLVGGIASVIWTDVIQAIVMVGAVVAAIAYLLYRIPAPIGEIVTALQTGGESGANKLALLKTGIVSNQSGIHIDWSEKFTLLTAAFGFSLLGLASYGTDHDMVQRMLTCKSAVKGGRSALIATFVAIPVVAMFMVVGLLLWVFYKRPEMMGEYAPTSDRIPTASTDQPFLMFIVNELPSGLRGLMIAGIFAVGLGSLNSAINAMAATFVKDFYMRWKPQRSERHYMIAGRWAVAGWGVILAAFAVLCIFWKGAGNQTLIDFALGVMVYAYSGLLAVFVTALFTNRGNSASAIAALITGFVVTLMFNGPLWLWAAHSNPQWFPAAPVDGYTADTLKLELTWLKIAFPWQLLIATLAALAVCLLGKRPQVAQSPA